MWNAIAAISGKDLPEVDALVGTNDIESIVAVCEGMERPQDASRPYLYHDLTPRVLPPQAFRLHEDCGRLRSSLHFLRHPAIPRKIPQPPLRIRRIGSHAPFRQGVREINLIGQDTTCYGEDLGLTTVWPICSRGWRRSKRRSPEVGTFPLRLSQRVTQKLLDTIAAHPALVKYIDMPLQHASPQVLKRMKRGATGDIFLRLMERIRRTIPGVAIRTSFIVGFPGETDADFENSASS